MVPIRDVVVFPYTIVAFVIGRPASDVLRGLTDVGGRPETRPVDVDGRELWLSISAAEFPEGTVYAFRDVTDERRLDHALSHRDRDDR